MLVLMTLFQSKSYELFFLLVHFYSCCARLSPSDRIITNFNFLLQNLVGWVFFFQKKRKKNRENILYYSENAKTLYRAIFFFYRAIYPAISSKNNKYI